MRIKFFPYNENNTNDTCVALCFFRPIEYNNPVKNLNIVLDDLNKANIPVFTIELLYGNQSKTLSKSTLTICTESSPWFSKENLWNIIAKHIPAQYNKFIFLDADVRFDNPDWFNISSKLLNDFDVIQCMSHTYKDIPNDNPDAETYNLNSMAWNFYRESVANAIFHKRSLSTQFNHTGFSVGITREYFDKINGFFEYGFNGCGDTLFWNCFDRIESTCDSYLLTNKIVADEYFMYKRNIKKQPPKISYVPDCLCMHLYHGSIPNRNYTNRNQYIDDDVIITRNKDGLLELHNLKIDLVDYWIKRKEDE